LARAIACAAMLMLIACLIPSYYAPDIGNHAAADATRSLMASRRAHAML
jgi:hypothetical protein